MQGHLLYNHKFSALRGGFPAEKINQRRGNPTAHDLRLVVVGPHQLSETLHPNQVLRLLLGNLQLIRLDVQFEKVAPAFIGASLWLHGVTLLCRWRRLLLCVFWLSLHRLLFLLALLLLEAVEEVWIHLFLEHHDHFISLSLAHRLDCLPILTLDPLQVVRLDQALRLDYIQ